MDIYHCYSCHRDVGDESRALMHELTRHGGAQTCWTAEQAAQTAPELAGVAR